MANWRLRLVMHPATVVAVAVLFVNDLWLKQAHPGWLTGKLSDVAGVWMVASLLIACFGRRSVGVGLAALGFVLLKMVPTVASAVAPLLGGTTRTDATDLLALALLPGPWLLGRRIEHGTAPERAGVLSFTAAVLVMTAATMTTTATSCDTKVQVSGFGMTADGSVVAQLDRSQASWYELTAQDPPRAIDESTGVIVASASDSACVGDRCFRVVEDDGLYEGDEVLVAMTSADRERFDAASSCRQDAPFSQVAVRDSENGIEVWVNLAMGGLLLYEASGEAHQIALPGLTPVGLDSVAAPTEQQRAVDGVPIVWPWSRVPGWVVLAILGTALVIGLMVLLPARRCRPPDPPGAPR